MTINLGSLIEQNCKQNNVKAEQLAKDLGLTTDAIYKMFKTSNIKIETVLKVSLSLKYDFFQPYLEQLEPNIYLKSNELLKENEAVLTRNIELGKFQKYLLFALFSGASLTAF